ncbi:MAG TPA: tetratricopeptide repeat protein, partial [Bryobacteraceae bacterium]|nr:tetratricopeptide repeat protein [Bryobacteraceae bacterium]
MEPATRGRCLNAAALLTLAALAIAGHSLHAETPEALGRNYRKNPSSQNRAALVRFAAAHPKDIEGAEALLALAAADFERRAFAEVIFSLQAAEKRLPKLADYTAYLAASSKAELNNPSEALKRLETVWKQAPASPLLAKSLLLAAKADLELKKPKDAIDLLRKYSTVVPQPQGDLLSGAAAEAMGDGLGAAGYYQRVYCLYPNSAEADQAETALSRLRATLGDSFPVPSSQALLDRAFRMLNTGDPARARRELENLQSQLGGAEREIAKVRTGAASYLAKENEAALRYMKALSVSTPEADAERLYYLQASARRLNRDADAADALEQLTKRHPKSRWRLQAMLSTANQFMVRNVVDQSDPMFRACYESFPNDPEAANCHWKVTWNAYLHRNPEAVAMLRAHLVTYPLSEKAAAALYFLARNAEKAKRTADAKAYYAEIVERFPHFFHAVLAREKLKETSLVRAAPSKEVTDFLGTIQFPPRGPRLSFEPVLETRQRMERARLLGGAGLDDWAENELRFGAKNDSQPHILAMELAQMADRRGSPDQAIRYIKSLAGGYLSIPFDAAPEKFWRLAFPLPYRSAVEMNSRLRSLD